MVRSKSEALEWYRQADAVTRIEFACDLLKMCFPCELRLIGLCAEELGRRDSHPLQSHETRANSAVELQSACDDLSDARARAKLAVYLCLLRPSNKACSSRLFDLLVTASAAGGLLPACGGGSQQPARAAADRLLLDDLLLLVTIAIHHPAFSVAQKYALVERLVALKDLLAALDPHVVTDKTPDNNSTSLRSAAGNCEDATTVGSRCRDGAEVASAPAASSQGPGGSGSSSSDSPDLLLLPPLPGRQALPNSAAIQTKNEVERESGKDRIVCDECSSDSSSGCCHVAVPSSQGKTESGLPSLRLPMLCNTADDVNPATFRAPSDSYSSSCSRSSSSCETKKPSPPSRSRVPRMRSAMPVDTSSSSPECDSPASTPRLVGHRQGHRCESGGTRQSRRASRIDRRHSQSPVPGEGTCPSAFATAVVRAGTGVNTACAGPPSVVNVQQHNRDSLSRRGDSGHEGDSTERRLSDLEQVSLVVPLAGCALAAVAEPELPLVPFPHAVSIAGTEEPAGKASVDSSLPALARPTVFPPAVTDVGSGEQTQLAASSAPSCTDAWDCSAAEPEVMAAHGGQPLAAAVRARDDRTSDGLGLPMDEASQASSETLSDPVAVSPTNELATSVSSGGEELAFSGDSCLHTGPTLSSDPYGDYASRVGTASQVAAAPLPLPPQAGYAIAATHGSTVFMPGYGGIVYCSPMPVYYGQSARRPRRGGGSTSAGHDLYYQQPCMQPCLVMHAAALPPPMYCAPPPPAQPQLPQQPGAETATGHCSSTSGAGSLHGSGLPPPPSPWTAASAACQRRADFCYTCGYSGHTGAQCPSQQQSPQLTMGLGAEGLQRAV